MRRIERHHRHAWLGLLTAFLLTACGQRGPLVLPETAPATPLPSAGEEEADEAESDDER